MKLLAAIALAAAGLAAQAADTGRTPRPVIERAVKGANCVEEPATMRRKHMVYLEHQRDATVHGGIRGAKYSLKDCIDCHASAATGSVNQTAGNFCVSCHEYAAVKIDCFECHTGKARAAAQPATR